MQNFKFPLTFHFKIASIANDFVAYDADGEEVAYVRQKMLKFKEDIEVFKNESRSQLIYRIKADRWIDFSAAYSFSDDKGSLLGKIGRKGWRSLWKAHYEIFDQHGQLKFNINEENAWVKVLDGLLGEIPILGGLSGYLFNPAYLVTDVHDQVAVRLSKEPSFWGRKFVVEKLSGLEGHDDDNIVLGLMMMVLLERRRG
jgi:hypothetical protein